RALFAERSPCKADVAAVQDQPVVRMNEKFAGHAAKQRGLDLERGGASGQAGSIGDAKDMRVDGQRRFAERDVQDDVGGLASDARQRLQRFTRSRYLAVVLLDEDAAGGEKI